MKYSVIILFVLYFIVFSKGTFVDISPTTIKNSNDEITISWSGIKSPTPYDIVAIYSPSNTSILFPNGYLKLSQSKTWKEGYGNLKLPLLNVREDYIFRLWVPTSESSEPILNIFPNISLNIFATSNPIGFQNPNQPGKSYLSITKNSSEMRLMWVSGTDDTPIVMYGIDSNLKTYEKAKGTSSTYSIMDMCSYPANSTDYFKNPGYIHNTVMVNLLPNTVYYYSFGSDNDGWSLIQSFITPSYNDISDSEAFVVAFGDLGTNFPFNIFSPLILAQKPATQTIASILNTINTPYEKSTFFSNYKGSPKSRGNLSPSLPPFWNIHHIGDISYAVGVSFIWDYYFDSMEPIISKVPYMVSIGNHEYDYLGQEFLPSWSNYGTDSGGECGVPYNKRFHMNGDDTSRNLWYSYNNGPIHFTVMSAEHDFLEGSQQYEWIVNDLKNIDRKKTPWLVFSGHRPMYTSCVQSDDSGVIAKIQEIIEPLFKEYDVNLALWAHLHTYERTCGIISNFTCADDDNEGTVHVVIGMAGNTWENPWYSSDNSGGFGHQDQPEWSIFRAVDFGHTRLYANQTNLIFEFVTNNRFLVHDSFVLKNKYN
ncbi:hypothetical protein DICPUDRAFT_155063 [Dictyostelium purpureum]|uniref:Purple acid phosphatase n=1 Tax=Dictyostelium purpureum TaxID=5786 RepID=F0ZSZ8_DICPU|nr:uncharacterized protein DICPUDRAFT_155063 [Dictyostelium purpureum]EGC32941.1 hypothetical protein DICPUDRAFT_155063 [Dictyostelium purpureum]|eukprot:XP_003290549.1 hypothetical protein DICPUDRAFT_155063 [Dictyostelium purpureum]